MKIKATDPDLATIYNRIKDKFIELQPDFQRGEVWTTAKKRMLIDTILRNWQIPPIHVILDENRYIHEVLDGQQRLCAIRDFMNNKIKVNGNLKPYDEDISELDGLTYSKLPKKVRLKFDMYPVRVFEIYEYKAGEPGELFNRLNQALSLTAAEKRNAYVGGVRQQIKDLVEFLDENQITREFLGFSNLRQAYEDLFAKLCYLLEKRNITSNPSDKDLEHIYREDILFSDITVDSVKDAIGVLSKIKDSLNENNELVHITKASLFSWLFFIANISINCDDICSLDESIIQSFRKFEINRYKYKNNEDMDDSLLLKNIPTEQIKNIYNIFNERASSRVMTSGSLLIRDACISISFICQDDSNIVFFGENKSSIIKLITNLSNGIDVYQSFDTYLKASGENEDA
ncbi:DUF262 domain-containing protein [Salmonella enterica subsp. enterica]|uniref:DUF262 domain-containing protein n=1 Tax=Pectobacterium versatile TaxID=2488639 RepID=UPI000F943C49|nr:DUF262 domain-containing protein [Pectobacterium versatile]EAA4524705.1 DUF262 domain-containing protein [Salmonella enterica subsp. enterica serovar Napoli]EAC0521322.1 DUF262 domain-containing protein [Salmonella enterica subsp. enterica serovar Zaiman]EDQ2085259.1 DUF262 domain-containing protein [Salmonella enterica]EDS5512120.1 DUF262 domain-containing protein [Salmonella enterica subsp. enterica]EDW4661059.1 DUF262 domain-containing protein [Salmonella enterica subsp. enterica serovar